MPEPTPYWESLLLTERGKAFGNVANVKAVLDYAPEWAKVFALNTFAQQIVILRKPPFESVRPVPRDMTDADVTLTQAWMQGHWCNRQTGELQGINAAKNVVEDAIAAHAAERAFSPLADYLNGTTWDGTPRIETWLIHHLGAADTRLNRQFGRKFLIASVARGLEPGCKVDTALILEGPQGLKKSSAVATLYGVDWTVDHLPDLQTKDAILQLCGRWCVEAAELDALNRAETARIKAFLSTSIDVARLPYGRRTGSMPRQCVFIGTVNKGGTGYLKDETGARRFWPVECGAGWKAGCKIDLAALAEARDQLWGEAVVAYRAGEHWWLDDADEALQAAATAERYDADAWTNSIVAALGAKESVLIDDMFGALRMDPKDWSRANQMRIGGALAHLGWKRERRMVGGVRQYVYERPDGWIAPVHDDAPMAASNLLAFVRP